MTIADPELTPGLTDTLWLPATALRNWCEGEPALDWLNLYGSARGYIKDTERPNYRKETDMSIFIQERGRRFETCVMELVRKCLRLETVETHEEDPRHPEGYARTLALMRLGVEAIYQPVVWDTQNAFYGRPDLLVRSDCLARLVGEAPCTTEEATASAPGIAADGFHYVAIDVKFKSFNLLKGGDMGAGGFSKKAQVAVYTLALGDMQGYLPPRGFLLGRCVNVHGQKGESRSCLDRLVPVTIEPILSEMRLAADWARRVRREGAGWSIEDSPLVEMQLNMSNTKDAPWHCVKRELATHLRPLSALWQVTPKRALALICSGTRSWSPDLDVSALGLSTDRQAILRQMLEAQRDGFVCTPPEAVVASRDAWGQPAEVEFFVDFETVTDLDDDMSAIPYKNSSPRIFMVGCGHVEAGAWQFRVFTADAMTDAEELRVLREWTDYMEHVRLRLAPHLAQPRVYHWSQAERVFFTTSYNAALKRLKVDLPEIHWYDLLTEVIRKTPFVVNGALGFGLKAVAKAMAAQRLISTKWEDGPGDGLAAMVGAWWCAGEAARTGAPMSSLALMKEIEIYNHVDCRVMWEILSYLRSGTPTPGS